MLGDQIKYLRKARQISQVQLAKDLGVSKQCISNWENNNILPSVEMLKKAARFFSCSTDFLLEMDSTAVYVKSNDLTIQQINQLNHIADEFRRLNHKALTKKNMSSDSSEHQ